MADIDEAPSDRPAGLLFVADPARWARCPRPDSFLQTVDVPDVRDPHRQFSTLAPQTTRRLAVGVHEGRSRHWLSAANWRPYRRRAGGLLRAHATQAVGDTVDFVCLATVSFRVQLLRPEVGPDELAALGRDREYETGAGAVPRTQAVRGGVVRLTPAAISSPMWYEAFRVRRA